MNASLLSLLNKRWVKLLWYPFWWVFEPWCTTTIEPRTMPVFGNGKVGKICNCGFVGTVLNPNRHRILMNLALQTISLKILANGHLWFLVLINVWGLYYFSDYITRWRNNGLTNNITFIVQIHDKFLNNIDLVLQRDSNKPAIKVII